MRTLCIRGRMKENLQKIYSILYEQNSGAYAFQIWERKSGNVKVRGPNLRGASSVRLWRRVTGRGRNSNAPFSLRPKGIQMLNAGRRRKVLLVRKDRRGLWLLTRLAEYEITHTAEAGALEAYVVFPRADSREGLGDVLWLKVTVQHTGEAADGTGSFYPGLPQCGGSFLR